MRIVDSVPLPTPPSRNGTQHDWITSPLLRLTRYRKLFNTPPLLTGLYPAAQTCFDMGSTSSAPKSSWMGLPSWLWTASVLTSGHVLSTFGGTIRCSLPSPTKMVRREIQRSAVTGSKATPRPTPVMPPPSVSVRPQSQPVRATDACPVASSLHVWSRAL